MRTGTSRGSTSRSSWYTSFGYFDDTADDLAALESARASLAPGGLLLLETQHRDKVAALHSRHVAAAAVRGATDGIVLRELWFDPVRGRAGEHVRQLAGRTAPPRTASSRSASTRRRNWSRSAPPPGCARGRLRRPGGDAVQRLDAPARGREAHGVILTPLLSIPSPSDPLIFQIGHLQAALVRHADRDRHPARRLARPARARPARLPAGPRLHDRDLVHPGRRDRRAPVPRRHRLGPVQPVTSRGSRCCSRAASACPA